MATTAQRTLRYNERIKLLAAAIDRASTGVIVVGVVAPFAATGVPPDLSGVYWIASASGLHVVGQMVLGLLR